MTTRKPETTAGQQSKGKFKPGQSGNPKGRPHGARHKTTLAVEALLEGEAEGLTRKAIEVALKGDVTALRVCLDRIAPASRERTTAFALPPIATAQDAPTALAAVIQGVADGNLSPAEAASIATLIDRWRAAFETSEIERRLTALESQKDARDEK